MLLNCCSETKVAFGGYECFVIFCLSDHTFIFVTLKKGLSCHRPGMKNFDNFSKSPYYYDDDHILSS